MKCERIFLDIPKSENSVRVILGEENLSAASVFWEEIFSLHFATEAPFKAEKGKKMHTHDRKEAN